MLFPLAGMEALGTPQSVRDMWPWWYLYIGMLVILLGLEVAAMNVLESIVIILMIYLVWMIVRNEFEGAANYVMSYGVLCLVQFLFDLVPLTINIVRGRVTQHVKQGPTKLDHGVEKTTYTNEVKTTPFFDKAQGWHYNAQSAAMLATPIVMLVGAWLSLVAWQKIMEMFPDDDADAQEAGWLLRRGAGSADPWEERGNYQYGARDNARNEQRVGQGRPGFQRFAGQGHKLGSN